MSEDATDYTARQEPSDSELKRISLLAELFVKSDYEIKKFESELEAMKKAFNELSSVVLPDAMDNVGMREFVMKDGYRIRVEPVFSVRLTKQNMQKADEWL